VIIGRALIRDEQGNYQPNRARPETLVPSPLVTNDNMINVIIADHQAIFRAGVSKVLAVEDDIRIVGQPQTNEQTLHALEHLRAHVLMISTSFFAWFETIKELTASNETKILVVAEHTDEVAAFVALGVDGVVYRSVNGPGVVEAVRRLARGEKYFHTPNAEVSEISEDLVGIRVRDRLSEKELRIVAAVVRGHKNRDIAVQMETTEQVIKNAIRSIFDKIGVSDRLELALFVLNHRMLAHATASVNIDPDPPRPKLARRQQLEARPAEAR
jgi:DNA-binding NarL/FixJ family response regulator